jgi:COMM domain containing 8
VIDELKDCVFKAIEVRKPQVCNHLVNLHNSSHIPLLKNFDWDVKFIIGNSSLASYREQKATLMLNCQKGKTPEMLTVELTRPMIEKMIQEIEHLSS